MKKGFIHIVAILAFLGVNAQYSGDATNSYSQAIGGSTGSWNNASDAVTENNNRATNSSSLSGTQYTDYIIATGFNLNVPSGETIQGVEFTVNKSKSGGNFAYLGDYQAFIVKKGSIVGGNRANALPWLGFDVDYSYGGSTDLWGTTLSPSDVNDSNFGLAISAQRYFGFGSPTPRIDHVSVTINVTATLPVELTYFGAENKENSVVLNWTTSSEIENDYFEIQRSKDGFVFETLARKEGKGNTAEVSYYSFEDKRPSNGVAYYRLKQVDFDGTTAYTDYEIVDRGQVHKEMIVFPNPATEQFTVSNLSDEINTMEIYDAMGKLMKSELIISGHQVNTTDFVSGWYLIKVTNDSGTFTQKLLMK